MRFDPIADQSIKLGEAAILTASFRKKFPNDLLANAYNKSQMQTLLNQTKCAGFRIYNGLDGSGIQQLVIVGVDANGDDLYEGILLDKAQTSPPISLQENPLNADM
jgi:hypothetical protein